MVRQKLGDGATYQIEYKTDSRKEIIAVVIVSPDGQVTKVSVQPGEYRVWSRPTVSDAPTGRTSESAR